MQRKLEFSKSSQRNEKAKELKNEGKRDVNRYSTVVENKSVFVVTWED